MRIRIWNAYASNNSGSYTIVGSFPSCERAAEVAEELASLMKAHELWLNAEGTQSESPLEAFAKQHALKSYDGIGTDDDWPQYSDDNVPMSFAIDHQVLIHHDYTVTLPPVFGQYFYARGGRVDHELNHAHHPVVGLFELYVPWQERESVDVAATISSIIKSLNASDGPLSTGIIPKAHPPVCKTGDGLHEADLTVGAIFENLLEGFTAVERIAKAHGMRTVVKVFESYGDADPLAFLRTNLGDKNL